MTEETLPEIVATKAQVMPTTTLALISPDGEILYRQEIGEEEENREVRKTPKIDEVQMTENSEIPKDLILDSEMTQVSETPRVVEELQEVQENERVSETLNLAESQDEAPREIPEILDAAEQNNDSTLQTETDLSLPPDLPVEDMNEVDYLPYYVEKYNLRKLSIQLERCDKIWETLKLIKNAADPVEPIKMESVESTDSNSSPLPKKRVIHPPKRDGDYVQYQPVLGNDNSSLPNFKFSVKSKKKLYHCVSCGREFSENRALRRHCYREHGIVIPLQRVPKNPAPYPPPFPTGTPPLEGVKIKEEKPEISEEKKIRHKHSNKLKIRFLSSGAKMKHKLMSHSGKKAHYREAKILQNLLSGMPIKPKDDLSKKSDKSDSHKKTEKTTYFQTKINDHFPKKIDKNIEKNIQPKVEIPDKDTKINVLPSTAEKPVASSKVQTPHYQCVLCKRTCKNIKNHLKEFHKVGCFASILPQCKPFIKAEVSVPVKVEEKMETDPPEESIQIKNEVTPIRKRKRKFVRLTLPPRKKYKVKYVSTMEGPFTCKICLGVYKNHGSYRKHSAVHMRKGETVENFDPTTCRYKNSPLCKPAATETSVQKLKAFNMDSTADTTDQEVSDIMDEKKDPLMIDPDYDQTEPVCECGRVFRNPHTLYLHKVKCKVSGIENEDMPVTRSSSDRDSGIGISIKIKKKNDSYEVVTKDNRDNKFKKTRTSKDSDVSSNDSGMASVDFNNEQQVTSFAPSKYSKEHSVLRIQVAEDDEDVDIEVDESEQSSFVGSNNTTPAVSPVPLDSTVPSQAKVKKHRPVGRPPKYRDLGLTVPRVKKTVSKVPAINIQQKIYICHQCNTNFDTSYLLSEHMATMNHGVQVRCSCGKKFKFLKGLNCHVSKCHPTLLKCAYCQSNFESVEDYVPHTCEVTENEKVFEELPLQTNCHHCDSIVEIGDKFDDHMRTHNQLPFLCFKCQMVFTSRSERRYHFSKEHGVSFCRFCGRPLPIDALAKHEAYHEGLGFPCHTCKKSFSSKNCIDMHNSLAHSASANELINCTVCSKSLKRKSFRKHMSSHLHEEICTKCNKCYENGDLRCLESHVMSQHPEDYPRVQCELCEQFFITEKRYQMHLEKDCKKQNIEQTVIKTEVPPIPCV